MRKQFSNNEHTFVKSEKIWYYFIEVICMKGYCDIDCSTCECYIATKKNDDRLRMNVAIKWSRLFNRTILPREINCTGCKEAGAKFDNCHTCKIREQHENQKILKIVVNG